MTVTDLLKCVECCGIYEHQRNCTECPIYPIDNVDCTNYMRGALAKCIKELQADVEYYKQIAQHQQTCNMKRWFEIERLKEEIERLKSNKHGGIVH